MTSPKRVLVLGSPGSGKTTLARKLSSFHNIPIIHLDTIYHTNKWPTEETEKRDLWLKKLSPLVKKKNWIMDSSNKRIIDLQLHYTTEVIFLDYPRILVFYRLLKRRLKFHRSQRPEMPSNWKERIDLQFWGLVWRFSRNERPTILSKLEHPKEEQVVRVLSRTHTKDYLRRLGES